jgi:Trk-type K+ transport system membrane component
MKKILAVFVVQMAVAMFLYIFYMCIAAYENPNDLLPASLSTFGTLGIYGSIDIAKKLWRN